jgi:hypothetical protein
MIRARYGSSAWHLLGHLALLAVVVYVLAQLIGQRGWVNLVAWLLAGALLHDFVFLPAYSAADRALRRVLGRRVNFARVPLALAGVLALLFFPLILGLSDGSYVRNAGHVAEGQATAWALITAGLLLAGAAAAAARRSRR